MPKFINSISGLIPNTSKEIDINLDSSNLIIIGSNGSGKTSFLEAVYKKTELLIVAKKQADLPRHQEEYKMMQDGLERQVKGTTLYVNHMSAINDIKKTIDEIEGGLQVNISENIEFSSLIDERIAVVRIFEARRFAEIDHASEARGIKTCVLEAESQKGTYNFGSNLEKHLVNLMTRKSLASTIDNDVNLVAKIEDWFKSFEVNLKKLMEDQSAKLVFDSETLKFSILQDNKPPYTFQTLSSGYMSIFDIYADLLMRTEYFNVMPSELKGTVFIDEIDAHLHVSLQRLILPFFHDSFPSIQFIVTTHSPFVLMSVKNTKIFDIGKNSLIDDDLSLYSYSAVMEGLFGTKTTSVLLEKMILDIAETVEEEPVDYVELEKMVDQIKPIEDKLDIKSRAFYMIGVNKLLDYWNK